MSEMRGVIREVALVDLSRLDRVVEKWHQQWSLCDDFRCNGILDHVYASDLLAEDDPDVQHEVPA